MQLLPACLTSKEKNMTMSCDDQKYLFRQSQFVFVYQNKSKLILSTWSDQNSKKEKKEEKKRCYQFLF